MKFLIAGLGNIGPEYANTRHNIGFQILDSIAHSTACFFKIDRFALTAEVRLKGKTFTLIKPTTYMNLSGKAVNYWLQKEKIPIPNLLVIADDIALPFGILRLKPKGSDGGHNGLKSIQEILLTSDYPRLRFGIGNNFPKGKQVDYVLGNWNDEEKLLLPGKIELASDMVKSFGLTGMERTMTDFNKK